MKKYVIGALAAVVMIMTTAGVAVAADKPNFSGTWKINIEKSAYGAFPPPESFIRMVVHREPAISIVEEQTGPGTTPSTTRKMTTDGKVANEVINGAPASLSATWEAGALTAVTAVDSFGIKFKDKMTLSPDGKTMTSVVQIESAQGNVELKIVFDKQ